MATTYSPTVTVRIVDEDCYMAPAPKSRFTTADYKKKSLMEKWRLVYNEQYHDPISSAYSNFISQVLFWYTAISQLYVMLNYCVPYLLADYSDMLKYYAKVACAFVFIETGANWLCTRFYSSIHTRTTDRPHPRGTGQGSKRSRGDETQLYADSRGSLPWKRCDVCKIKAPFRSHHCIVCKRCVLKRDHHCFFSGACIGFWNQRYFVILNFYIFVASSVGFISEVLYLKDNFTGMDYWDYCFPVTLLRYLVGWISIHEVILISHMYLLWWTGFAALGFFCWQLHIIRIGKTTYEIKDSKQQLRCTSSSEENVRSVFGEFWLINFVFPAVLVFPQTGDGKHWDNVKFL